jgi:hypothetical protein
VQLDAGTEPAALPRWRRRLAATCALVALAAACGDDGGGGGAKDGASSFEQLIGALVPVGDDQVVTLVDVDRLVDAAGLDPVPDDPQDIDEVDGIRLSMSRDWGVRWLWADSGSGVAADWVEGIGFGPGVLERGATVMAPPTNLVVLVGDVPVDDAGAAIRDRAPDAAEREDGDWVLLDEAGTEGEPDPSAGWGLERIGRPLRYAAAPRWFVASTSATVRDAAVAAIDGDDGSLLDEPGWQQLAATADERGAYSALVTAGDANPGTGDDLPPTPALVAALLEVADGEPLPLLAFVYDDEDTAEAAAEVLARRLEETTTEARESWTALSPDASVSTSGVVAVVELPGAPADAAELAILRRAELVLTG